MDLVVVLIKQNLVMLVYMMIGFVLFKKKMLGKQGSADLSRVLLYVVLPVSIMRAYIVDYSVEMLKALGFSFLAAVIALALSVVVTRLLFHSTEPVERFGTAFSNAGFIGIPLIQMTMGQEAVFYASSFIALLNIAQWTYGVVLFTGTKESLSFRKIRTNPIILAFLAGVVLFFLPIKLPETVSGMISTIATMNGPIAMIVLGTYLAQLPLKEVFRGWIVYRASLVRLLVVPVLTVLAFALLPSQFHDMKLAVLISASAPIGSNVAIFAQLYDQDYTLAVREVCVTTVLSIASMPLVMMLANWLL